MTKKILVTSALPYANGSLHCGHMVEYIQTDIFVRFLRLIGEDVIYVCADDTHGTPIQINAEKEGLSPEKFVEKFYKEHTRDFAKFLIKFDNYYSTNSPENKEFADFFFNTLNERGYIYKKSVQITYCEHCRRALPDRYVKGECPKCHAKDQYGDVCEVCGSTHKTSELIHPYCSVCKNTPIKKESEHYFFKLSAFSKQLDGWLTSNKSLQPEIVNYIRNWIKDGLEDWDITRDGPYFGFKIPGEENKYYYVWLDAPIGYVSSSANYCKKNNMNWEDYWKGKDSRIIHFIGKDIIYFHFLFWPAILMGVGFNLPDITVHGFLTVNGDKMSKSRGTFFTAEEFANRYPPELLRFYYAKSLSRKMADIDLNFEDFIKSVNNELVANIANFSYRVVSFINKNFESTIEDLEVDEAIIKSILAEVESIRKHYENMNFNEVVKGILHISSIGNKYFQDNEPWKMIKTDKEKAAKVCGLCMNMVKNISILISPIMPKFAEDLQKQLNLSDLTWEDIDFELAKQTIKEGRILIEKLPDFMEEKTFPLNLKVAEILEVIPHPEADKLYVLQINLGTERRQLVAGIRQYYSEEELVGKKIVVVTNLKPAKLRGIESQGMLLAADDGKAVRVLEASKSNPGDHVFAEDYQTSSKEITIEEFTKLKLSVKNGKPCFEEDVLETDSEEISISGVEDGARIR